MDDAACKLFDEWWEAYRPIRTSAPADGPFDGCLFETFGDDLGRVEATAQTSPRRVWTIVETTSGAAVLIEGFHVVNRLGYFITSVAAKQEEYELECFR